MSSVCVCSCVYCWERDVQQGPSCWKHPGQSLQMHLSKQLLKNNKKPFKRFSVLTSFLFFAVCHQEPLQASFFSVPKERSLDGLGWGEIWCMWRLMSAQADRNLTENKSCVCLCWCRNSWSLRWRWFWRFCSSTYLCPCSGLCLTSRLVMVPLYTSSLRNNLFFNSWVNIDPWNLRHLITWSWQVEVREGGADCHCSLKLFLPV